MAAEAANATKPKHGPQLVAPHEPAIEWQEYPRIAPGFRLGYCKGARLYVDKNFKRWVCLLRWDILDDLGMHIVAGLPQWFALGDAGKDLKNPKPPKISRNSNYWKAWVKAAGRSPARNDRLSPSVFIRRHARLTVRDTKGRAPYSVVAEIKSWETGGLSHPVSQYTSGCPVDKLAAERSLSRTQ